MLQLILNFDIYIICMYMLLGSYADNVLCARN